MNDKNQQIQVDIVGLPGAGKTSLAQAIAKSLKSSGILVYVDPQYLGKPVLRRGLSYEKAIAIINLFGNIAILPHLILMYLHVWYCLVKYFAHNCDIKAIIYDSPRLAAKLVRKCARRRTDTVPTDVQVVISDTSVASLVAPYATRQLLQALRWSSDLLIVIVVDPDIAYGRLNQRARRGDKHRAMSQEAFNELARRSWDGAKLLSHIQLERNALAVEVRTEDTLDPRYVVNIILSMI